MKPIIIRADANTQIGTGHVMRCLALAQAWQEAGGKAYFATAFKLGPIGDRLNKEGFETISLNAKPGSQVDAIQTVELAHKFNSEWVVVDGYHFGADYQKTIKDAGLKLLFVDDYGHATHYYADIILNQNIYANETLYRNRQPDTQLLLGTDYVLLRREFRHWQGWRRKIPDVARKVLVTLGGGDPDNLTLKVIHALQHVSTVDLEVAVVIGGSNPHRESLHKAVNASRHDIRLLHNVTNMPELMAWADIAISAGGSTCWELTFMGLPGLLLILADNQRLTAEKLASGNMAYNLGWHKSVSSEKIADALLQFMQTNTTRITMSQRGKKLVDGYGVDRVVKTLGRIPIRARPVNESDIELLFLWVNDPLTRKMSLNSSIVSWEEHRQWFKQIIDSPKIMLLIIELYEEGGWSPFAQVRFDGDHTVSISLSPKYRGRHLAKAALKTAINSYLENSYAKSLTAYIKADNKPSQIIFTQLGFKYIEQTEISGQPCLKYCYQIPKSQEIHRERNYV